MKLLLTSDPAAGTAPAETKPAPPSSAEVVKAGKTERELELERELEVARAEKQTEANRVKKLETDVSHVQAENQRLREAGLKPAPAAKEKFTWMGFGKQ